MKAYRLGTALLAVVFVGIGVALVVEAAIVGGGIGIVLGALFIAAGSARLYLLLGKRGSDPRV